MPKKLFSPWSQIPLKNLTDSIRCHVSANKMMTCVTLTKKYKYIKNIHLKKKKKSSNVLTEFDCKD
jgi:hypothetical protein